MCMTAKDAYQIALDQFVIMQNCFRTKCNALTPENISDDGKAMMSLQVTSIFNLYIQHK